MDERFTTPRRPSTKKDVSRRSLGIDLVTGKANTEYFFDPDLKTEDGKDDAYTTTPFRAKAKGDERSKFLFLPCTIVKEEDGLVKTSDGTLHKISDTTKLIALSQPEDYMGMPNVLTLPQVTEASLLHTLRVRYLRSDIYTAAGPILISINPYKTMTVGGESLYSEKRMFEYRSKSLTTAEFNKAPHLFQVANRAFNALVQSNDPTGNLQPLNQSIIISGESGAGKTEATKVIMQFLARITQKREVGLKESLLSPDGKFTAALEDKVLSSNPLLETFGNAQTLKNDNSSRFGKFIHIYFDTDKSKIKGAAISNYLLEKTRICHQIKGERNYHVFYQLLAESDQLKSQDWNYLTGEPTAKDKINLQETKESLLRIGLSEDERTSLLDMVISVLYLGNIQFREKEGDHEQACIPEDDVSIVKTCQLLGLEVGKVKEAVHTKFLSIGGKIIPKKQNVAQAQDKRDAFAKMLYSSTFLWLVKKINTTLHIPEEEHDLGFIGVLDIYGFEVFDVNGFEQLLINYCNEKLQRHFNRHLFEVEQDLYQSEGVDWSYISFNDNRPCLDLIEGSSGTIGILNNLDDSWGGMGTAAEKDIKFVGQLHKQYGGKAGHEYYVMPKFGIDREFVIKHYAGEVKYTADGFVEKNMDTLSNELKELGVSSNIDLVKEIFSMTGSADLSKKPRSAIRGASVGSQFKVSLQALMADLEQTQPHYIRCIKPNLKKKPDDFDGVEVLRQLKYSGMMEAIRIRREGYALREEHQSFYEKYSILLHPNEKASGIEELVKVLSKRLKVTSVDWQIGHSKIFLRAELANKLERLAALRVHSAGRILVKFGRKVAYHRLSRFLVLWVRFRLHVISKNRCQKAATRIVANYRSKKQMRIFKTVVKTIIKLQSHARRQKATQHLKKLKDPYGDMTFEEVNNLYKETQSNLDRAVAAKDFPTAAKLEPQLAIIKQAVEDKRPLTRGILENMISELEKDIDDALGRKDYDTCTSLQVKLEELKQKREDYPTMEELEQNVKDVEDEIAKAIANRDFAGAADGQDKLADAKKRLAEAIETEKFANGIEEEPLPEDVYGFVSRAELEQEITELNIRIKDAIDSKKYREAQGFQVKLDELEGIRQFYPTVEDLKEKLAELKKKQEEAIAKKDFGMAGEMDDDIEKLESKIQRESERATETPDEEETALTKPSIVTPEGETKVFESRAELDSTIKDLGKKVADAVAKKEFKKAQSLQAFLDDVEKLQSLLPSLQELDSQLSQKKKEMDAAIAKKDFEGADSISKMVTSLEERVALEKSKHPKPDSKSIKSAPVIAIARQKITTPAATVAAGVAVPTSTAANLPPQITVSKKSKTVAKLRPIRPLLADGSSNIVETAKLMSSKRSRAALIANASGGVGGIITDSDITRRVIARHLDPSTTKLVSVMTPTPTYVSLSDSGIEALSTMIENRFRHLPVVDEQGKISGLLDIGKCLDDAITRLEKAEEKNSDAASKTLLQVASLQGAGGNAAALQALLGPLLSQALGDNKSPTLRSLLAGKPSTVVDPTTSVMVTAQKMSENKKAALVVDKGALVGILSFKDVMSRVIAKELPLSTTPVSDVMTPNPEAVLPHTTVIDALTTMHDNKFFTLPVCEEDGRIVGLVDVMDVIYGCGGSKGWQSIFGSSMDFDDDLSEVSNGQSIAGSVQVKKTIPTNLEAVPESAKERPVSKLRPKKALITASTDSILSVTRFLANKRGDASLVVDETGALAGIITDTDVTRRVVAKGIDITSTSISEVMTPKPTCVAMSDSAMEALTTMVENHFRHLPVVDDNGGVVGLLDIAKCLNDAISKLERAQKKTSDTAEEALKSSLRDAGGAQAAALQALLGPLMSQAFGGSASPKLRSILAGKPATIVSPGMSIRDAGNLMAERRKAALVVKDGKLVGIFGFKDMMTRAVAKQLALESTPVETVMTPNPEAVSPEITVLEALQIMHDNRFLTLPVCEENGSVVGLVDVMDLIYSSGGADGWRSIFSNAMEMDDLSETSSTSHGSRSIKSKATHIKFATKERPVSKLRPKKPLSSDPEDSVLSLTQMLANKRSDASIVVSSAGGLVGIITDTDITRRLVAKDLEAVSTSISSIMTANPTCVSLSDPALDALGTMIENHFRHLPVVDDAGAVVGLLDIAKCLNDAISKLEKVQEKKGGKAHEALKQVTNLQGAGGVNAASLQALLGPLIQQAFGGSASPKLRSILASRPATIVSPATTLREAGQLMAERRKAALVVEGGKLVGIFGFKDMMTRAVAKQLPLEITPVSAVMTPNPEAVSPEMTVLEALQTMHDNKFLTLPVCEENGAVVGLIDVMDLIYNSGGQDGWRSMFGSVMDMDDGSASVYSRGSAIHSISRSVGTRTSKRQKDLRPVEKLRPKKPILVASSGSALTAAKKLAETRGTAAIVVDSNNSLVGIITDTDITRRVAAKNLDPSLTDLSSVMTPSPACVSLTDGAMDALTMMIENRYRHLPVVDESGSIAGVLDIGKCLNDAISKLEKAEEKGTSATSDALQQVANLQVSGAQSAALQALLGPLMAQALGGEKKSPSLRSILAGKPATIISKDLTVLQASERMAESRKAALIVEEGELVGILSFKDVMSRVIAKELPLGGTSVASVMTTNPESINPESTVLEALQIMHDNKFLTLPVCEEDGTVVGLVDVMDVIYGCGGSQGWRSIFDSTMDMEDASENQSVTLEPSTPAPPQAYRNSITVVNPVASVALPNTIPRNIEFGDRSQDGMSLNDASFIQGRIDEASFAVFKITALGNTHRIRCLLKHAKLVEMLLQKLPPNTDGKKLLIKFVDNEGDEILITTDEDLLEAAEHAKSSGAIKLKVELDNPTLDVNQMAMAAAAVGVAVVGVLVIVFTRSKK